jgi:uncharacterized membrane protein YdfJ with MMPL/SSD domain
MCSCNGNCGHSRPAHTSRNKLIAQGPLESTQTVLVFAIVFGLSTDYRPSCSHATMVSAFPVPSLTALPGCWNWWAPRSLQWLYHPAGLSEGARTVA